MFTYVDMLFMKYVKSGGGSWRENLVKNTPKNLEKLN